MSPSSAAHWRWFPAAYKKLLGRFLYQFDLYGAVYDAIQDSKLEADKMIVNKLKSYILYMDRIIMAAWEQCRLADASNQLTPDWRCEVLDDWLVKEYHVGMHTNDDLEKFNGHGHKFVSSDPMELGNISTVDWSCS